MDCKNAAASLHPYLDDELSRADVDELERHLASCAKCRGQLASLEALRNVVRENAPRFAAPADLRRRLEGAQVRADVRPKLSSSRQWWAMAASVLVAFLLGVGSMKWYVGRVETGAQRQAFVQQLLSSHLRALASVSAVDVVSTDRHTVKPWFAGRIPESPPVVDLAEQGFPLVGGRIDYVGAQRVGVLVYGHGQHLIDVYLLPEDLAKRDVGASVMAGYRVEPVRVQEQAAWIVSDVDEQELAKFRAALTENRSAPP